MKKISSFIVLLLFCGTAFAQSDSSRPRGLRVSLLTVSTGDEIYAAFGHTGIRITDSAAGTDRVYNWGTFDGFQENFELKFMRGMLLYYCSDESYLHFVQTYIAEQRGVQEQEIFLSQDQAKSVQAFLNENLLDENRYYKYNFLYDNCATRPRDVFEKTFGASFRYGPVLPAGQQMSFRDEINHYLAPLPWERLGINLLLGRPVDKKMSNEDAMFLPDNLMKGMAGASVDGKKVSEPAQEILPAPSPTPVPYNIPFFTTLAIAVFIIVGSAIPGIKPLSVIVGHLLLIVTGLLGCLMLFMWLGTDHDTCRNNFNVLWCLPTNLIIPFVKRRKRSRYALVAIVLLLTAVALHVFHVQTLPFTEIWPLLLSLLYLFGMIYRLATEPLHHESDAHHPH